MSGSIPDRARLSGHSASTRVFRVMFLLGLCLVAGLLSITFGARDVALADIVSALTSAAPQTLSEAAVVSRVPRTVLAALAGAALGAAGAAMQGLTRNPLADPGLLGVNAGAALAIVIGFAVFGIESVLIIIGAALLGATITAVLVYTIASLGYGGATPIKLALSGAAVTAALSSMTTAVVQAWLLGGVGGATFEQMLPAMPFLAVGALAILASARRLNTLALGEEMAAGLGENVLLARALAASGAVILAAAITSQCGPIGFVGLVVPHACRIMFGVDYRWILPTSALAGAALLMLADVAGRLVARPGELDVGIVMALIGAPFFIWIVRRGKVASL